MRDVLSADLGLPNENRGVRANCVEADCSPTDSSSAFADCLLACFDVEERPLALSTKSRRGDGVCKID